MLEDSAQFRYLPFSKRHQEFTVRILIFRWWLLPKDQKIWKCLSWRRSLHVQKFPKRLDLKSNWVQHKRSKWSFERGACSELSIRLLNCALSCREEERAWIKPQLDWLQLFVAWSYTGYGQSSDHGVSSWNVYLKYQARCEHLRQPFVLLSLILSSKPRHREDTQLCTLLYKIWP